MYWPIFLSFFFLSEYFFIADLPHTTHNCSIRSDEGLTLETSAFESLYGGQFTLSTQLMKPNYLLFPTLESRLKKSGYFLICSPE